MSPHNNMHINSGKKLFEALQLYNCLTNETKNVVTQYCGIRTIFNSSKKYGGAGTFMTIFNPDVESSQYSSARLKIKNEPDSIQVGWTVSQLPWLTFKYCSHVLTIWY